MKTRNLITTLTLILGLTTVFAGSNPVLNAPSGSALTSLRPVAPSEATFNDGVPEAAVKIVELAPVTPGFASFDESSVNIAPVHDGMKDLAPEVPAEAGFEDVKTVVDTVSVLPVVPVTADFTDLL